MASEFSERFAEVVEKHGGTVLEPPYEVPKGQVGFRFIVNNEVLGAASFSNQIGYALVIDDLKDNRSQPSGDFSFESERLN